MEINLNTPEEATLFAVLVSLEQNASSRDSGGWTPLRIQRRLKEVTHWPFRLEDLKYLLDCFCRRGYVRKVAQGYRLTPQAKAGASAG